MRWSAVLFACALFVDGRSSPGATGAAPPLPPPRPPDLAAAPPPSAAPQLSPGQAGVSVPPPAENPEDPSACDALLSGGAVTAKRLSPIVGESGCGVAAPVSLEAVLLPGRRAIQFDSPVVLRCDFAAAAARWIASDLVPLLEPAQGKVVRLAGAGGYQCRTRNGADGAVLSEHARGNAMDIDAVVFEDGRVLSLSSPQLELGLATTIRSTACDSFSTVLGPGADAAHERHIHLDLERRRHGGRLCEWDLE
jgi:hypothetical protein